MRLLATLKLALVALAVGTAAPVAAEACDYYAPVKVVRVVHYQPCYHVYYGTCSHDLRCFGKYHSPHAAKHAIAHLQADGFVTHVVVR